MDTAKFNKLVIKMNARKDIEKIAEENMKFAREEQDVAKDQLALAKLLKKKADARKQLMTVQLDIAKIQERLAGKNLKVIGEKVKTRKAGLLSGTCWTMRREMWSG